MQVKSGSHWALLAAVVLLLIPLSFQHYLLFHTLAETVSIVIAAAAFAVAWSAYPFSRNHLLMYLGIVLFWSGAMDLVHTLLYKGMNIFEDIGANPATEVWIATRYLQAAGFLAAALFADRPLSRVRVFLGFGLAALLLLGASYVSIFPDAYEEGVGLTTFKIVSEYVIIAIFLASIAVLWGRRASLDRTLLVIVSGAIAMLAVAELAFTLYVDVYGLSNLTGHLFKVVGYWLLYWALVDFTVEQPFRMMARTASTYDAVPEAIVVVDRDGVVRQANHAALLAAPECVGGDWHEHFHPARLSRADCPMCAALARGEPASDIELECSERWHEFTLSPVRRKTETSGMVQVRRDVTERRQAAKLVEESERRFRALTENSNDLIFVLDGEGVVRYASASLAAAGGYRPDEVVGRSFAEFVHPDDVAQAVKDLGALRGTPEHRVEAELRYRHKNGGWRVLGSIAKNALADPAVQGIVVNARDVTRRKETERQLREQLDELRRFQKVSVGRELRMQELEAEIRRLELALAATGVR